MKYKDAGVDISLGDKFKGYIKKLNPSIGGFAGTIPIPKGYKNPLLVGSADSVGTKLKIALELGIHNTVGEDIVNHCINDIFTIGAIPLYFMDYIGVGKLNLSIQKEVIDGILSGCKKGKMLLLGGETAELPGLYKGGDYDLVGFITGIVEKSKIIDEKNIVPGDKLVGFASNGLHTNGYSLVRKIIKDRKLSLNMRIPELKCTLGEELLKVHKSYKDLLLPFLPKIKGLIHITGGGFYGNIPRILPKGMGVKINKSAWKTPPIFKFIQREGKVDDIEMFRVFNMGIGMIAIVKDESVFDKLKTVKPLFIGETIRGNGVVIKH